MSLWFFGYLGFGTGMLLSVLQNSIILVKNPKTNEFDKLNPLQYTIFIFLFIFLWPLQFTSKFNSYLKFKRKR